MQKILFDYDAITAEMTLINFDLELTLLTHNMALLLTTIANTLFKIPSYPESKAPFKPIQWFRRRRRKICLTTRKCTLIFIINSIHYWPYLFLFGFN